MPKSVAEEMQQLPQHNFEEPESDDEELEKEEISRLLEEENIMDLPTDELENLTNLDALTGSPFETDIILNAIPVCAPYNTLQSYKYRIKLLPGSLKKGKAAKSALSLFLQKDDITTAEKDAIKSVPEQEWIQTVLGKVKLMAPGMEQSGSSNRKSTKKK